jgi:hypothetical protein
MNLALWPVDFLWNFSNPLLKFSGFFLLALEYLLSGWISQCLNKGITDENPIFWYRETRVSFVLTVLKWLWFFFRSMKVKIEKSTLHLFENFFIYNSVINFDYFSIILMIFWLLLLITRKMKFLRLVVWQQLWFLQSKIDIQVYSSWKKKAKFHFDSIF